MLLLAQSDLWLQMFVVLTKLAHELYEQCQKYDYWNWNRFSSSTESVPTSQMSRVERYFYYDR